MVVRVAVKPVMQSREKRAHDHDDDTDVIKLIKLLGKRVRVTLDGVVARRKSETDDRADKKRSETGNIEGVGSANAEISKIGAGSACRRSRRRQED